MSDPFVDSLAERLALLERENARLVRRLRLLEKGGIAAALAGVLVLMVGGASFDANPETVQARTVEAQSFVLKDSNGKTRAVLGAWERAHAVRLRFLDELGQRLDVGIEGDRAMVTLYGKGKVQGIRLEGLPDGTGTMMVRE
jgi:hypothetical protein